ncbi:heme o synthase [Emcibacter nanhaiensis]|uniref:Protoheme IX farnesyltransferase n=1 Tax=Emcibacter nanhaiensis TaxID=1505037 RepID=A0A501PB88_9PROT|nr:heme o synthase [Emcibacter nanhaiensis]TPD57669.1 protoheme IX farnesyltransferase [Emcibacter nanhaiensis]
MYASSVEQEKFDYYEPAARDFFDLLKPRVMSLVIFTGLVGLLLAPGHIHPVEAFTAILCIAVAAGASGCLNMWYDADIDAVMDRTRNRPIPAGRVAPETALQFGVWLSVASVLLMGLAVNVAAAVLLAITIGFYIFVYTMWLKRRTPQNIVIGGAAGAFPPMIGWVAVTGNVSIESLVLFGIIFMWTPPHFWALSLFACKDYEKVGVPMLPVVSGEAETRKQILIYSLLMVPVTIAPWVMGFAGMIYGVTAVALGGIFLALAARLFRAGDIRTAKQLFFYSILYLFVLFAVLGIEALLRMGGLL